MRCTGSAPFLRPHNEKAILNAHLLGCFFVRFCLTRDEWVEVSQISHCTRDRVLRRLRRARESAFLILWKHWPAPGYLWGPAGMA